MRLPGRPLWRSPPVTNALCTRASLWSTRTLPSTSSPFPFVRPRRTRRRNSEAVHRGVRRAWHGSSRMEQRSQLREPTPDGRRVRAVADRMTVRDSRVPRRRPPTRAWSSGARTDSWTCVYAPPAGHCREVSPCDLYTGADGGGRGRGTEGRVRPEARASETSWWQGRTRTRLCPCRCRQTTCDAGGWEALT